MAMMAMMAMMARMAIGKGGACLPAAPQLEIHGALPAAGGTTALRG
jgi:hypothetical protein